MKIFTICILLFFSCKQTKEIIAVNHRNINQIEQFTGNWQMCKSKSNGSVVLSNICQTINFRKDGKGKLLLGDKLICTFKWKINKKIIKFSFDSSDDQSNFLYGVLDYNFKLYDKGDLEYLEIKPQDKEVVYFLSRVKINK